MNELRAAHRHRAELLATAKQQLSVLKADSWPFQTISAQLDYLEAVNRGAEGGARLPEINLGLVAVREIEPSHPDLCGTLHEIAAEARKMAEERLL